jgi:hypothetical protein
MIQQIADLSDDVSLPLVNDKCISRPVQKAILDVQLYLGSARLGGPSNRTPTNTARWSTAAGSRVMDLGTETYIGVCDTGTITLFHVHAPDADVHSAWTVEEASKRALLKLHLPRNDAGGLLANESYIEVCDFRRTDVVSLTQFRAVYASIPQRVTLLVRVRCKLPAIPYFRR